MAPRRKLTDEERAGLKRYVPAIKELIEEYGDKERRQKQHMQCADCPLCCMGPCRYCPWEVIEGDYCLALDYITQPFYLHIKRLKRWLRMIQH